jgi:pimeloyl-ACP methyl ester carboxylesterase
MAAAASIAVLCAATACSTTTASTTAAPTTPPPGASTPGASTPASSATTGSAPPAGASSTTPPPEVGTADALYAVPSPIPDAPHGTLLKYQEVIPSSVDGARTYRIMYSSRSVADQPIVETGVALVPLVAAPADGRVTLTIAHGTTGIADECAPSKAAQGLEIAGMGPVAKQGWLVALADYEGMGTPGRHPYLVGESEGRSVVDAALAVRSLPGADAGPKLAIAGYSQGGHGALWAGQVAPTWAPQLTVVGTFAGAPATENDVILKAAARLPINGFSFMMVAGYQAAYPEADPAKVLTPAGLAKLDAVDHGCTADVFKATAGDPAELFRTDGTDNPPWSTLMAENNPGNTKVSSPLLIIHSDDDSTVPVGLSAALFARMCKNGQVVERRVLEKAGGHIGAAVPAYVAGIAWLQDMAAGKAPVNGCPAGGGSPSTTAP